MSKLKHHTTATTLQAPSSAGFALLEILVVIGLLSILALGMTAMLEDDGDWQRAQETPKRWDAIRKAILGDGSVDATGNPNLSGYVVDMGRLPQNIRELIEIGTQPVFDVEFLYKQTETTICVDTPENCYTLENGWRGPYLHTAGSTEYRDGWRNSGVDGDPVTIADDIEDANNFGWQVNLTSSFSGFEPNQVELTVSSFGFGNIAGANNVDVDPEGYTADFPVNLNLPIVAENEWLNPNANVSFNIRLSKAVTANVNNLYLAIYFFHGVPNNEANLRFLKSVSFSIPSGERVANVNIVRPLEVGLPLGRYAAVIYCENPDPTNLFPNAPDINSTSLKVFDAVDGTCDLTNQTSPFYFQMLPNSANVNMIWNLP